MNSTDINDGYPRIVQFCLGRVPSLHRGSVCGDEHANRQQIIFVGTAGVGQNRVYHGGGNLLQPPWAAVRVDGISTTEWWCVEKLHRRFSSMDNPYSVSRRNQLQTG